MDISRLHERIDDYLKATAQLSKACLIPKNEFIQDAVIHRFEFTSELAWKMLKLRLEAESIFARTPRETLQEALQAGLIDDGNSWSEMQKMRNLTSLTYNEKLADTVYTFIVAEGLAIFQTLAKKASQWRTQ